MTLTTYTPADELAAVNAILAGAGEAPVLTLDAEGRPDAALARATLSEVLREVCTEEWRFNTEFNFRILPDAQGRFPAPAGMLSFRPTPAAPEGALQLTVRAGFFYDRSGRGHALGVPELHIDPTWFVSYAQLPEAARRFVITRAGRRYTANLGVEVRWTAADEGEAYRVLRKTERDQRRVNLFDNPGVVAAHGGRQRITARGSLRR